MALMIGRTLLRHNLHAPESGCITKQESLEGAFGIPECMPPNRRRDFHSKERCSNSMKARRFITNALKSLILPVIVYLIFAIGSGFRFGNINSLSAVIRQSVYPVIIAWAICNNQTMGVWDFTPGSIVVLSGILGGQWAQSLNVGPWGMFLLITAAACICTQITCTVFTFCRIPSMVTGLGMLMIFESLCNTIYGGGGTKIPRGWTFFAKTPYIFMILLISFFIIYFLNNYTKFGYDVRSLGNGTVIAKNIGVNQIKTRYLSFLLEGVFLGIASVVNICYNGASKPVAGSMDTTSVAFSAIMAVMVGAFLSKYCDLLIGTMFGALALKMLASGMLAMGLASETQQIGNGVFLILFLAFANNQHLIFDIRERNRLRKEVMAKAE